MTSIEDYELIRLIGQGGFAQVFAGRSRKGGTVPTTDEIAIKRIDKVKILENGLMSKVESEIRLHQQCNHPGIVACLDSFEDTGYFYMVLELAPQGNLFQLLRSVGKRSLSGGYTGLLVGQVRIIMTQLVAAVAYLHSMGVIHRDIKLSNVLVEFDFENNDHEDGRESVRNGCPNWGALVITRAFLCDFGLATQVLHPDEEQFTFCGTPNYISPEIILSNARNIPGVETKPSTSANDAHVPVVDVAMSPPLSPSTNQAGTSYSFPADVWSLGVLAYTCLCGFPPFDAANSNTSHSSRASSPAAGLVHGTLRNILYEELCVPAHMLAVSQSSSRKQTEGGYQSYSPPSSSSAIPSSDFAPIYRSALELVFACLSKNPVDRPSASALRRMEFLSREDPALSPPPPMVSPSLSALEAESCCQCQCRYEYYLHYGISDSTGMDKSNLCIIETLRCGSHEFRIVYSFVALKCSQKGRVERKWCGLYAHNLPGKPGVDTEEGAHEAGFSRLFVIRMNLRMREQLQQFMSLRTGTADRDGVVAHSAISLRSSYASSASGLFSAYTTETCDSSSVGGSVGMSTSNRSAGLLTGSCTPNECNLLTMLGSYTSNSTTFMVTDLTNGLRYDKSFSSSSERLPRQLRQVYRKMLVLLQTSLTR